MSIWGAPEVEIGARDSSASDPHALPSSRPPSPDTSADAAGAMAPTVRCRGSASVRRVCVGGKGVVMHGL